LWKNVYNLALMQPDYQEIRKKIIDILHDSKMVSPVIEYIQDDEDFEEVADRIIELLKSELL
jgi:hypothetical protein